MEPTNKNTLKNEEDVNLLAFRRRNKIIILIFLLLIISIALILGALITYLIQNNTSLPSRPPINPAVKAFCYVVYNTSSCIRTINYIISMKSISEPNQIFSLSLQTAAKELQNVISSLPTSTFKNCSSSLRDALSQIEDTLTTMQVNPFVQAQSDEQRVEMMNQINGAGENIGSCLDDVDRVNGSTLMIEKLLQVEEYVKFSEDFLVGYAEVLQMFWSDNGEAGATLETLFEILMFGSQLLFMFFMFWALRRMR